MPLSFSYCMLPNSWKLSCMYVQFDIIDTINLTYHRFIIMYKWLRLGAHMKVQYCDIYSNNDSDIGVQLTCFIFGLWFVICWIDEYWIDICDYECSYTQITSKVNIICVHKYITMVENLIFYEIKRSCMLQSKWLNPRTRLYSIHDEFRMIMGW